MSNEIWVNYKTASRKASDYMVSSTKIKPFVFINPPQMQSVGHFHKHYVTGKFGVHGVATALRSFLKNKS